MRRELRRGSISKHPLTRQPLGLHVPPSAVGSTNRKTLDTRAIPDIFSKLEHKFSGRALQNPSEFQPEGMQERIPLVKSVARKRNQKRLEGAEQRLEGTLSSALVRGSSIKVDGRPGAIVRRCTPEISIYNDVKDRRTGHL
ncbi:hypothetical protein K0M31_010755 [Melipona bicolor]|uniref:Uncharacterized protein n=1 Tax=Melipona bicolor TaxID=60889 RepID=A0AA40FLA1_9HYME|nr:hypothetical protein K0M31_010755 [Melipona bicolor]